MKSPFDELGKPPAPEWEEVGGAFDCQTIGCHSVVGTARYIDEASLLTWKCEQEHLNRIEDFHID